MKCGSLKYAPEQKQRKEFLKWVNNNLVCRKVNSLEKDFRNGLVFVELIDCLGERTVDMCQII